MACSISLSVVIPAYNEVDRIHKALIPTIKYLSEQDYKSEIIVVSDGSTDGTTDVVRSLQNSFENLRTIEYHPNYGKGRAVRTGIMASQGKYILFMDADYSVPIQEVEKGLRYVQNGYGVAIGSRALQESKLLKRHGFLRELAAKMYTAMQNLWLGIPFRDTQCGFKIFTSEVAYSIFPLQKLNSVIFDGELLFLAKRQGVRIAEFPVEWVHDEASRITYNMRKSIAVFIDLFRIRWIHRKSGLPST